MNRYKLGLTVVVAVLVFAFVARPMYGTQEMKGDPKEIAKLITDSKFTLIKAIEAAEKETKGIAVKAFAEKYPDGVHVDVYCVVGDAVKWAEVDQTGKVVSVKDAHEKEAGWGKPEPKEKAGEPAKGEKKEKEKEEGGKEPKKP